MIPLADAQPHPAHQRVTVQGEVSALERVEVIPGSIRRGAAQMFYPEANVLMRPFRDLASGTPAIKRVPVLVRRTTIGMQRSSALEWPRSRSRCWCGWGLGV